MMIPKTLKIGGHPVQVVLVDEIRDGEQVGRWDPKKNQILIAKDYPPSQLEATLIHEILHALNVGLSETDVEFLSQALYQVLLDNKLVFDAKADK